MFPFPPGKSDCKSLFSWLSVNEAQVFSLEKHDAGIPLFIKFPCSTHLPLRGSPTCPKKGSWPYLQYTNNNTKYQTVWRLRVQVLSAIFCLSGTKVNLNPLLWGKRTTFCSSATAILKNFGTVYKWWTSCPKDTKLVKHAPEPYWHFLSFSFLSYGGFQTSTHKCTVHPG